MPATMEKVDAAGVARSRIKGGYPDAGKPHCLWALCVSATIGKLISVFR